MQTPAASLFCAHVVCSLSVKGSCLSMFWVRPRPLCWGTMSQTWQPLLWDTSACMGSLQSLLHKGCLHPSFLFALRSLHPSHCGKRGLAKHAVALTKFHIHAGKKALYSPHPSPVLGPRPTLSPAPTSPLSQATNAVVHCRLQACDGVTFWQLAKLGLHCLFLEVM